MSQKVTEDGEKTVLEGPAKPVVQVSPPIEKPQGTPTEIYLQSFSDYASGRFRQAILGFETFLRFYPNNDYVANAQYWLGECYYSLQDYARAVQEFQKMASLYPEEAKTPEALLRMASALTQMNQPDQARGTMELLRARYPESPAAKRDR
jgi:tol-pal system protein YbgF